MAASRGRAGTSPRGGQRRGHREQHGNLRFPWYFPHIYPCQSESPERPTPPSNTVDLAHVGKATMRTRPPAPRAHGTCPQGYKGFQPPWPPSSQQRISQPQLGCQPAASPAISIVFNIHGPLTPLSCTFPRVTGDFPQLSCAGRPCTPKLSTHCSRRQLRPQRTSLRYGSSTGPPWVWHWLCGTCGWRSVLSRVVLGCTSPLWPSPAETC